MPRLNGAGMKILKIFHLMGAWWLGGAFLPVLYSGSHNAASPAMPNGVNYASHPVDLWIVVSLGVYICLITGFLYSLQTPRGFVKFRRIMRKWIITRFCFASGRVFPGSPGKRHAGNVTKHGQPH